MKKFIISVLCVSVFFIGLGGLVERTSAKFKSDARALELVRLARVAIGGEANINNVRSMTISGTSSRVLQINGASETKQGSLEINLELPNKFSKMVRIGDQNGEAIQKQVDVVVVRQGGELPELPDAGEGKKVIIVKDENGKVLTEDIKPGDGQRKIIIKSQDGKTELIKPAGDENAATFTTEDGKTFNVQKDVRVVRTTGGGEARQNEMLRTTLALLLTAPEGSDVNYTFAGETSVDGATCNVVEVASNGSTFKLFLDKSSNLPKMISYMAAPMKIFKFEKPGSAELANKKEVNVFVNRMDTVEPVEHQLRLTDFRSVGGLLLPHKWTESVGGEAGEMVDISGYEINPANIADKFKNEKVFVRTQKPQ